MKLENPQYIILTLFFNNKLLISIRTFEFYDFKTIFEEDNLKGCQDKSLIKFRVLRCNFLRYKNRRQSYKVISIQSIARLVIKPVVQIIKIGMTDPKSIIVGLVIGSFVYL